MLWFTKNPEETMSLAQHLLPEILNKKIVLLSGELGSGKTTFVKGLAKALGINEIITSPTYVYLKMYQENNGLKLCHVDLYRFQNHHFPALEEALQNSKNIIAVEWPEKIEWSEDVIVLRFEKQENGHSIKKYDKLSEVNFSP